LERYPIGEMSVIYSPIGSRTAEAIGTSLLTRAMPSRGRLDDADVVASPGRILLLGAEPSESITRLVGDLHAAHFVVVVVDYIACQVIEPHDFKAGTIVVDTSPLAILALAKGLGYTWEKMRRDFAASSGPEQGSPTGKVVHQIFASLPAPHHSTYEGTLAKGVHLFLASLMPGKHMPKAQGALALWLNARKT
jgi:hypothetical protein